MATEIAIIDDEPDIQKLITIHLTKASYISKSYTTGESFIASLKKQTPQLIILDLMLPDCDGYDLCKKIRQDKNTAKTPLMILSAKAEEIDRIIGLELGADDYLTKPFSPKELIARIRALLRRTQTHSESLQDTTSIITYQNIVLNPETYQAKIHDQTTDLTVTEFKILYFLARNPGIVFTREKILQYLWGNDKIVIDRTIDVHIRHLREKLGEKNADLIKNIRGIGYKLAD